MRRGDCLQGLVKKLGLFAGIMLELFYQDCLGLLAPLVTGFSAMGVKDTQRALLFIQAITDAATKRIEGGHDAEAEINSATAFCINGLASI